MISDHKKINEPNGADMMNRILGALAATTVLMLGLVLGAGVYAQQRSDAPMGGMMGMMGMMKNCPMHQAMAEGPERVLEHREELGLSGDQVAALERLQATAADAHAPMMARMMELHREIAAAASGDRFEESAVRTAFERMAEMHTEMGVAMLRTRHAVREVLTHEQREKLSALGGGMMGMHGMMGGMGGMGGMNMEDCPMMRGMMGGAGAPGAHHDSDHPQS